jgi:hypothetical protein
MTSGWPNAVPAKAAKNQTIVAVDKKDEFPRRFIRKILTRCVETAGVQSSKSPWGFTPRVDIGYPDYFVSEESQ